MNEDEKTTVGLGGSTAWKRNHPFQTKKAEGE